MPSFPGHPPNNLAQSTCFPPTETQPHYYVNPEIPAALSEDRWERLLPMSCLLPFPSWAFTSTGLPNPPYYITCPSARTLILPSCFLSSPSRSVSLPSPLLSTAHALDHRKPACHTELYSQLPHLPCAPTNPHMAFQSGRRSLSLTPHVLKQSVALPSTIRSDHHSHPHPGHADPPDFHVYKAPVTHRITANQKIINSSFNYVSNKQEYFVI